MPEKRAACGPMAETSVVSEVWVVPVQPMPVWLPVNWPNKSLGFVQLVVPLDDLALG